jgi:hypothetical protein
MRFIALFLVVLFPRLVVAQTEYFPLHSDALWTYGGSPLEIARTMTLRADTEPSSGHFIWEGPFGTQRVILTEDGLLAEVTDSGLRTLLDFSAQSGDLRTIDVVSDDLISGSQVTVLETGISKPVSFGAFDNVIHFELRPPEGLSDAGVTDLWFAPKIELIAFAEITIAGPQTYELAATAIPGDDPVAIPTPAPVDPEDLFPASIGLTWSYDGPFGDERLIRIIESTSTGSETALILSGLFGDRLIRQVEGRVEQFSSGSWRLLFDLSAQVDEFWTIDLESSVEDFLDGARVEVIDRAARIAVPYGDFEDVTHFRLLPPPGLADAGLSDLWLAPGVGIVAWSEQSIAGPRTYSLVSFSNRFEPFPFPEPLPGPIDPIVPVEAFWNRSETTRDGVLYSVAATEDSVRQGDVLFLEFMTVGLEGEHVFRFTSTQQVEFILEDVDGERVWTWSRIVGFGDALTTFTLVAGDTVRFVERLDLRFVSIPEGVYTLTGFLPTSDFGEPTVPAADTRVSVNVKVIGNPDIGVLDGTVRDPSGEPVSGAVVSVNAARPRRWMVSCSRPSRHSQTSMVASGSEPYAPISMS